MEQLILYLRQLESLLESHDQNESLSFFIFNASTLPLPRCLHHTSFRLPVPSHLSLGVIAPLSLLRCELDTSADVTHTSRSFSCLLAAVMTSSGAAIHLSVQLKCPRLRADNIEFECTAGLPASHEVVTYILNRNSRQLTIGDP